MAVCVSWVLYCVANNVRWMVHEFLAFNYFFFVELGRFRGSGDTNVYSSEIMTSLNLEHVNILLKRPKPQ